MSFRRFLFATVYGIALCGWGAVWIAERVHPAWMMLTLAAILGGIVADRSGRHPLKPEWNRVLLLLGMGAAIADWRLGSGSWFLAIVLLMLYVSAVRALAPKANRDLQQMIGLAFLQLLAASVLTASAAYALFFLAFFVIVPFALLAVTVKAEFEGETDILRGRVAEGGQVTVPPGADRLLSRGAIGAMFAALGMTTLVTTLFFVAFPRLSTGTFTGRLALDAPTSGLSDEVRLGSYGKILQDSGPAARLIWLRGQPPVAEEVYLRGLALDTFDGTTWRAGARPERIYSFGGEFGDRRDGGAHRVRVLLEDLGTSILPVVPVVSRLEMPGRNLLVDALGGYQRPERAGPYRYEIETRPFAYRGARVDWAALEARPELPSGMAGLTALPEGIALPAEITSRAAAANLAWLPAMLAELGEFRYTLETPVGDDPLAEFWRRRSGHCELFATSLALALRSAGVPAVVVTGFRGAEWIGGEYMLVRNRNAHSWVEVWHPALGGWLPLDPTPALEVEPGLRRQVTEAFQRAIDGFRLFWLDRIVDYDLETQAKAVAAVREAASGFDGRLRSWTRELRDLVAGVSRGLILAAVVAGAVAGLVVVRWLLRRRRLTAVAAQSAEAPRWLRPLLNDLEKIAGRRPVGFPLDGWLRGLDLPVVGEDWRRFLDDYGRWRFGAAAGLEADLRRRALAFRRRLRAARRTG